MTIRVLPFAAAATALGLCAMPAAAQMIGNPVYYSPKHGLGLSIQGDFGRGLNDASGKTNYFGGRAVLGLPMITVSAGAGVVDNSSSEVTFGGTVSVNVLSAPLLPVAVALQGGAGYMSSGGGSVLSAPIGIALAVKPPTPGINVEVWGAPRIQITRVSAGGSSATETDVGASAGANLGLPTGLGLHAAVDWINAEPEGAIRVGVGVHYKFTIPGLGMMGM